MLVKNQSKRSDSTNLISKFKLIDQITENENLAYFDFDYKYFSRMLPASNLPMKIKNFIGRKSFLNKIDIAFNEKKIVILNSYSGTGKTCLANEYSHLFKSIGFVYWIIRTDIGELNQFAEYFGIELTREEKQKKHVIYEKIKMKIFDEKNNFHFLFVFDNLDEFNDESDTDFINQLANLANAFILITIKDDKKINKEIFSLNYTELIELERFDESESNEFFRINLKDSLKDETDLNELMDYLQIKTHKRTPYALNKMITFLKLKLDTSDSLKSVIKELKLNGKMSLDEIIIDDSFFDFIKEKNEKSINILNYACFLDSDFMYMDIFTDIVSFDEDELNDLVTDLEKLSLIKIERKNDDMGLKIHATLKNEIHAFLRNKNQHEFHKISDSFFQNLIHEILKKIDDHKKWKKQKYYSNFKLITENILASITNNDNIKIESLFNYANFLDSINMYHDEALNCFNESLEIIRRNELDELVVETLKRMGIINSSIGRFDEALKCFNESLDILKNEEDETNNNNIAIILNNIGNVYLSIKNFNESLKFFNKSLDLNVNECKADSLNGLGSLNFEMGCYTESLKYYEESLEMTKKLHGSSDLINSDIANSLSNIGLVFDCIGQFENSFKYYNESLEINRKISENDLNPNIAILLDNLGINCSNLGKYKEACEYYNESLEMKRNIYSTDVNPRISDTLNNIGRVYKVNGNFEQALIHYNKSIEIDKQLYANGVHPDIATTLNNIGEIYLNLGDLNEAKTFYFKSLDINREIYSNNLNNTNMAHSLHNIGEYYLCIKDYDEALKYFNETLEIERNIFKTDINPHIADTLNNIGVVYLETKKHEKSLEFLNKSLKINRELYDSDFYPNIADTLNNIGLICREKENYDEALVNFTKSLEIYKKIYETDINPRISDTLNNIGDIYFDIKEYEKALEYFKESLEIDTKLFGSNLNKKISDKLNNIGCVYMESGDLEKAKKYSNESLEIKKLLEEMNINESD